ncbi:MAG: hypothetical protein KDE04_18405, partial [Anaerolineales bacterium]|nr:hypothetical protein [Anaerolineales bacterium]
MSTKLGLHVTHGSRNGYGAVVAAAPAVVLAVGEGGALTEAKEKSGGRTITIFREQNVYHDAPPGIDQMTADEARAAADNFWPALKAKYAQNPADFYQVTNETGGDNRQSLRNIFAFEERLMELAEKDGFRLAVASPAGGSPGSFDLWVELFVPHIRRAGQGGHIYSRHAYGGVPEDAPGDGFLTLPDGSAASGNAARPFREAEFLRKQGIRTPMVITEAGPKGGFEFPGAEAYVADMARYDQLCMAHENIWGFCCWTYGNFMNEKANIQDASTRLADYLRGQDGATARTLPTPGAVPAQASTNGTPKSAPTVKLKAKPKSGKTAVGIHASADGGLGVGWVEPVLSEIHALQPEVIKFQSSHGPELIGPIVADNRATVKTYIIRAFLVWDERPLTPDEFIEFTFSDVERVIKTLTAHGVADSQIIVELHNEPNLRAEGLGFSWANGQECVSFFVEVMQAYKQKLKRPAVQYGLGALSPGKAINDKDDPARPKRANSRRFLEEMMSHAAWNGF